MDNKIEVFKNEQFGEIRTALIENEPWFVAVDVCRALEIGNSSQAISRLDADEKMITLISNEGNKRGNPNMTVVNEPGLYTLILSSRKPEAKAFKRWITHDVIPMIRKTGGYMTDSLLERIQKEPAVIVEFAQALILEKNRVKALECELNTAKPKADFISVIQSNRREIFFLMSLITALVALIQRLNSPFSVRMPFFSIARTVAPSWTVGRS